MTASCRRYRWRPEQVGWHGTCFAPRRAPKPGRRRRVNLRQVGIVAKSVVHVAVGTLFWLLILVAFPAAAGLLGWL